MNLDVSLILNSFRRNSRRSVAFGLLVLKRAYPPQSLVTAQR